MADLRAVFSVVTPYLVPIPLYGGMWMMACASPTLNPAYMTPLEVNRRVATRGIRDLQYYKRRRATAPRWHCPTSFATWSLDPVA